MRKALLRKAGEFAVSSPKLQRAEAAISGRHLSEEVDGLHRRITEALQDERHEVLGGIPPCRVRLVLVVDVCRGCSAGFLSEYRAWPRGSEDALRAGHSAAAVAGSPTPLRAVL